jgi:uncharacterized protein (TIGR03067 family)
MRKQIMWAIAAALLLAADAKNDEAVNKDLKLLEGTWKLASMEVEGTKLPDEQFKDAKLVCTGTDFTFTDGSGTPHKGTFKIDPTKKPKTIDITFTDGPNKGETMLGIYEVNADTYTICAKPMTKERPTEFSAKQGSGCVLEVLMKQKK